MKIIAVTSCPVGAAHTYMAAAALEKAAKKGGHEIKVETQGGLGLKNKLSAEDVNQADVLILATDVACLELERFNGIAFLKASTKRCIRKGDEVLEEALALTTNKGVENE